MALQVFVGFESRVISHTLVSEHFNIVGASFLKVTFLLNTNVLMVRVQVRVLRVRVQVLMVN